MTAKRTIKVFIASPSDLPAERRAFKKQIDVLNIDFGDGANVEFVPLGWEDTLASTGPRAQDVINLDIDKCDVFILAMYRRWGQDAPDSEYDSYTEEEFHRALDRWNKTKESPVIFVFFKKVSAASTGDPGPQLAKVLAFQLQLEKSGNVIYHRFADDMEFGAKVDKHLRAYAKGELPKLKAEPEKIILPIEYVERLKQAESFNRRLKSEAARAEDLAFALADQAAQDAREGRVEQARQAFAKAASGTTNLATIYLSYEFFSRTGELDQAEELLKRWLTISGPEANTVNTAAAYGNLGIIYQTRGKLKQAEDMLLKSLEIFRRLDHREGMSTAYANLGIIYQTRGALDQAEKMYCKSLDISEELGFREGVAIQYSNLGIIHRLNGDLDQSEEMHNKSLSISEEIGYREGLASQYSNLGVIYQTRGDLDRAEEMHLKSLKISEELGHLAGIASYFNNLGLIYKTRKDLDRAEEMHLKSLDIEVKLGRLEGMANQYGNLGVVYNMRKKPDRAREWWVKARDLFTKIGIPHMADKIQKWIDEIVGETSL